MEPHEEVTGKRILCERCRQPRPPAVMCWRSPAHGRPNAASPVKMPTICPGFTSHTFSSSSTSPRICHPVSLRSMVGALRGQPDPQCSIPRDYRCRMEISWTILNAGGWGNTPAEHNLRVYTATSARLDRAFAHSRTAVTVFALLRS